MIELHFKATGEALYIDRCAIVAVYASSADPSITVVERRGSPNLYLIAESVEDVLRLARPWWRFWG